MNTKHLKFFAELAKTEHMARAADNLGISQPSLSYAISNIEKELGVPLFEKDGRNIKLTNYGEIYLHYVQTSLSELDKGSEHISELLDINSGHINLGFTYTVGQSLVPQLISQFKTADTAKNIQFSFSQNTTSKLLNLLSNDKLDLIFASLPQIPGIKERTNIYHLVNQEIQVAVPNGHPLANLDSIDLETLSEYPLIFYSKKSGLRPFLDQLFEQAEIIPNIRIETEEDHTILGFVHWGFGIALIPHMPQLAENYVKILHIKNKRGCHPIYLITKLNHFLPPATVRFANFAQSYCYKNFINKNKLI